MNVLSARVRAGRQRLVAAGCLAAVAVTGSAAGRIHTVEPGETLEHLGRRYQVPVSSLAGANSLGDPDRIVAGTRLLVPVPAGAGRHRPAPAQGTRPAPAAVSRPAAARPEPAAVRTAPVRIPADRIRLRPLFVRYSREAGVPADLVMALAWQESGWQSRRVSSTRAVGVMQLMPDTVDFVSRRLLGARRNLDPWEPAANIRMGTRFLRYLLDRSGGNVEAALAAYHQGLRSLRDYGPLPESHRFVANVKALRPRFR